MHIILLSITVIITYVFFLFLDSKQTNYSKIDKLCLFVMDTLNVKWPVAQTEEKATAHLLLATSHRNFNS